MTLAFEHDLDRVKMNKHAKFRGQRSFNPKAVQTHRHPYTGSIADSVMTMDLTHSRLKLYDDPT